MAYNTPPNWVDDTPLLATNLQILSDDITYLRSSAIVMNAPSATTPNSSTTAFAIGTPAVSSTWVAVYVNGLRRRANTDYTHISGENHVDFLWIPQSGDDVRMDYIPT
jgi:hypothetical protein